MKRYQLNLLSVAIILIIISLAFIIYYQYSMNIKKQQENLIFENFINNLQNLENTINSIQGTYYVKVNIPNGVILYANGTELIIQYNNNNYTINFYKNVTLYNNNQNVSFLYPNNYIYLVSTNNTVFITTNLQNSIAILNEYLPNGTLIYITPENNQNNNNQNNGGSSNNNGGNNQGNNNNNINQNAQCLVNYNGQTSFFWGDVNGNDYLPPIGDQGDCGDCWAFASSNGIASIYMIRNNEPNEGLQLSPAYLAIECNNGSANTPSYCEYNSGCNGGWPYFGILFASQYGIPPDPGWSYYESTLGNHCPQGEYQGYETYPGDVCNFNYNGPSSPLYYPKDVTELVSIFLGNGPLSDQQIIQDLLCYGPLVVGGLMGGTGGSNPNIYPEEYVVSGHAMLLVGYNTNSQLCQEMYGTPKCWIFENQWGERSGCILVAQNGEIGVSYLCNTSKCPITACSEYYFNYQLCNQELEQEYNVLPGWTCGGVYWMQDGYVYVPFDQSPYGLSFPQFEIVAIQNVTLTQ
jgi:hypothetical protein